LAVVSLVHRPESTFNYVCPRGARFSVPGRDSSRPSAQVSSSQSRQAKARRGTLKRAPHQQALPYSKELPGRCTSGFPPRFRFAFYPHSSRRRSDNHVSKLAGLIERSRPELSRSETQIDRVQRGERLAIHQHIHGPGDGVVGQLHVMPAPRSGKRCRAVLRADTHALAAIDVKNTVMHGLFRRCVHGEMRIVEMTCVVVSKRDEQRPAERPDIRFESHTAVLGKIRQRELNRAARPR